MPPAINYPAPQSAFESNPSMVLKRDATPSVITEIGKRTLMARALAPEINSYGAPAIYLVKQIVPNGMALELERDETLKNKVKFLSDGDENWVSAFEKLLTASKLHAKVNWHSNTVSVFTNPDRSIELNSSDQLVTSDKGETYVIRNKKDDISAIQNNGVLIQDGEAYRLNVGE